jgi:hypothetical protein
MVIPPENFDEVLDFAQMHGFSISKAAQEAIEAARMARENTLTVSVSQPQDAARVVADGVPSVLEVPQEVEIDESLRDDD